jgi:hypothetical protein
MPALPAVPNVLQVKFRHTLGSDLDCLVRLFFSYTGTAPSNSVCATLASDFGGAWNSHLKALCSADVTLNDMTVTDLTSATAGKGQTTESIVGTRSGTAFSANTAVLVNYGIARRYRGGRPRSYWPFFVDSDLGDPQTWVGGSVTAAQTAYDAFITACDAISESGTVIANHVNVSYYHGFAESTNPITGRTRDIPTPRASAIIDTITSSNVSEKPASQRRRLGKR